MMSYIAALDYEHMDNGVFLTSFGRALSEQQDTRAIVVHGESEYTERLIQTGIMRDEAKIRCIKDLNHRLVALLADEGVSTIGLNGYHKGTVVLEDEELQIDRDFIENLPPRTVLLLSNLVLDREKERPVPVDLDRFVDFLRDSLVPDEIFLFSRDNRSRPDAPAPQSKKLIPEDFERFGGRARLTTTTAFARLPDLAGTARLDELK